MTVKRMDKVLIVVDDLEAVKAFFIKLGLELDLPLSSFRTRRLIKRVGLVGRRANR